MPFAIRPYRRFPVQRTVRYHAGLSLLIAVLLLNVGQAFAEWVSVDSKVEEGLTVYLELDTIRRSGDVVKMWELWDFKTTRTDPKPPHMSVMSQREIDCTKKRGRLLAMTAFSGNMGSGMVVHSYSDFKDQEIQVEPDSVADSVVKVACGKP